MDKPDIPLDDESLNLLEEAVNYHFSDETDEKGDPIAVGEFSLYQLLDFWSGYDPSLETREGSHYETNHNNLCSADVIKALIHEIRRLRSENL